MAGGRLVRLAGKSTLLELWPVSAFASQWVSFAWTTETFRHEDSRTNERELARERLNGGQGARACHGCLLQLRQHQNLREWFHSRPADPLAPKGS